MPFKSEKQRRFLWAAHPDIAKKWADKYPESNKGLPMYAKDKDDKSQPKEKAAQINIWGLFSKSEGGCNSASPSILAPNRDENCKKADSKQERVDIPRSEKPVYAGEEREKGMISSGDDLGDKNNESCGKNAINTLLQKLSVVLAPKIEQTIENMNAENEGRVPRRVGNNANLKQYPLATPQIPLPMGMSQAQAPQSPQQTQQTKPANSTPVGAGQSTATTDPIKFHSGLSASGVINGNAALSAPNTVNTKISAETPANKPKKKSYLINNGALAAGILTGSLLSKLMRAGYHLYNQEDYGDYGDTEYPVQDYTPDQHNLDTYFKASSAGNPVNTKISAETPAKKPKKKSYLINNEALSEPLESAGILAGSLLSKLMGAGYRNYEQGDLGDSFKFGAAGNPVLSQLMSMDHCSESEMLDLLDLETDATYLKAAVEKWAGKQLGLWDRIRAKKQRGEKPASPGDKDYPDAKSWSKVTAESEKKSASSPAWQRSAGKNDEGGLNAKGRASYNKATGGNLKAPVTEKNPTGERDKRQNSFCSRMCGMKRVNTGSKTKKDPDSRINKALRKWNCKCGSDKNAFVTGFMDDAINNTTPLVGALGGGAVGALGGGAIGGLHGAMAPGEYTDESGKKQRRSSGMGALRGLLAGAGLGGVGGAVGGAVGLPMLTKSKPQADLSAWIPGYDKKNTLSELEKRIQASLDNGVGPDDWTPTEKQNSAYNFGKEAARRVLNLSPSWGGQKWQLGEWGINPQAGYRYLGGVLPTPDIALRLGGPMGGTAVGLAPFPYIETDWGRPSGRQANKETRSLYKWIGDGMRDRPTAAAHALANVPEDATAEDYEAAMRSSGVGYSSKELKRLADRMAKMGPLQLPVE